MSTDHSTFAERLEKIACHSESYAVCEHGRFLRAEVPLALMRLAAEMKLRRPVEEIAQDLILELEEDRPYVDAMDCRRQYVKALANALREERTGSD